MRAMNVTKAAALAAAMVLAAGCSTTSTSTDGAAGAGADAGASAFGSGAAGASGASWAEVSQLRTVFYFDFDQSVVKQDGFSDLEAHARYLAQNPSASVRLEGHADERGTREYNVALGERRAKAVEQLLIVNGAAATQIETISFGEEKPAVMGHGEGSWSQNRRVELKYVSQ